MRDGQCAQLTTQSVWEIIGGSGSDLSLLAYRGTADKSYDESEERQIHFYVPTSVINRTPEAGRQPADTETQPETTNAVKGADPSQAPPGDPTPALLRTQRSIDDSGRSLGNLKTKAETTQPATDLVQAEPKSEERPEVRLDEPTPQPDSSAAAQHSDTPGIFTVLVVFAVCLGGYFVTLAWSRQRRTNHLESIIIDEIAAQSEALRISRQQKVFRDHYGTLHLQKWEQEKRYFVNTRIAPLVLQAGYGELPDEFVEFALERVEEASRSLGQEVAVVNYLSSPDQFDPRMSPQDYEVFCARKLISNGWDARTTIASGDQGVDVVATKGSTRLVVQCKLYSNSIGNDAVQQVIAAKTFERANVAAVVSNQPYTKSARQIAEMSGVHLLHHDQLATFDI